MKITKATKSLGILLYWFSPAGLNAMVSSEGLVVIVLTRMGGGLRIQ